MAEKRSIQTKSPTRIAVEAVLAAAKGEWMTNREIAFTSGSEIRKVMDITGNMLFKGTAESRKWNGKTQYRLLTAKPKSVEPETPHRNGTTEGNWTPPKWEPARTDADDHKRFGSLDGDQIVPFMPPKSCCVGVVSGPVGGVR